MKVGKLLIAGIITVAAFTACTLDFKNSCDDKWVVTNNSTQNIEITFSDSTTTETIDAATKSGTTITPKTAVFNHKADATIEIASSYHVDYSTSYNYAESTARRALFISDQTQYSYEISNTLTKDVTFTLNTSTYANTLSGGVADPENENLITYTIDANNGTNNGTTGDFIIYKSQPTFTFYESGTTNTVPYTTETDSDSTVHITIK